MSLCPWDLRQIDTARVVSFGKLAFIHVCGDNYSHAIYASAQPGDAFRDAITAFVLYFIILGLSGTSKTDHVPVYTFKAFKNWCLTFAVSHLLIVPLVHRDRLLWNEPIRPLRHRHI